MSPEVSDLPDASPVAEELLRLPVGEAADRLGVALTDRPAVRRDVLRILAERGDEPGAVLLAEAARRADDPLALEAIEALALATHPRAGVELGTLAQTGPSKPRRKAAARALHRLRSRGVTKVTVRPQAEVAGGSPEARLWSAVASAFDPTGNRALLIAAERALGGLDMIFLILSDTQGSQRAVRRDASRRTYQQQREALRGDGLLPWAEVPPEYGYWLAEEAREIGASRGEAAPASYLLWRRAVGEPAIRFERPLVYEELSAAEVRLNPTWLESSAELLQEQVFLGWLFDPEQVRGFTAELVEARGGLVVLSEQAQAEREAKIVVRAIEAIFDAATTRRYRRRLEEMAHILLRNDESRAARQALAVAVDLPLAGTPPPTRNPFIRALVLWSFALAKEQFGLSGGSPILGRTERPRSGLRRVGDLYLP